MAITEKSRNELRTYLEDTMGEERATTLMDHLPPVGWADVATRQDLDQLRRQDLVRLSADVEQLRADTNKDIAHLREIMNVRFEAMNARFDSVDTRFGSMDTRFGSMDTRFGSMATKAQVAELCSEIHRDLRSQTMALMAMNVTLVGLILAAVKLA